MLFLIALGIITALTFYVRHLYTFWQRRGFPSDKVSIPFGCLDTVVKRQRSFGMAIYDAYKRSTVRFVGIYLGYKPALLIRDANLARDILVQDFESFHDRGLYVDEENDPFSGNLFALRGERWSTLRHKLAPSFTSGKLKGMFGTIEEIADRMVDYLNKQVTGKDGTVIEAKQVLSKYAIDIIGSVIFGLDYDSFKDPQNVFRRISERINTPTFLNVMRGTATFLFPTLEKWAVKLGIETESENQMKRLVYETVKFREENNYVRKDLMQMLIQLRKTGKINLDDKIWSVESAADDFKSMPIETIASQAFLFFIAGFETSAGATAFTLYEIARNPEIYAKVKEDVEQSLAKHDGKITYESLQDMKYLELCLMESLRKYPGLPILNRECTKDYLIPGSNNVIEKGTSVIIPIFGIQRDEENFPEPLKFDPERHLESNKNYNPAAYMPFGEGPRHCIAQRLGKINVKVALAKLLLNYDIEPTETKEIEIDNFSVSIVPKGGVNIRLRKKAVHV